MSLLSFGDYQSYQPLSQPPHRALAVGQQPYLSQAIAPTAEGGQALAILRGLREHIAHHEDVMTTLGQWFELRNGQPVGWNDIVMSCCDQLVRHAEQVGVVYLVSLVSLVMGCYCHWA
jgi:hypothetical protein